MVIVVTYLGVMILVGYLIFEPFTQIADSKLTGRRVVLLSDLMAIVFSFQLFFTGFKYLYSDMTRSVSTTVSVSIAVLLLTAVPSFYGLRLLWRLGTRSWLKRIVLLGIIMPAGFVLPVVAFPIAATAASQIGFLIPMFVVVAVTIVLRKLSHWVKFERASEFDVLGDAE